MSNLYEEFTQLLSLGTDSEEELNAMEENKVEYRKQLGKLLGKSRKDAKGKKCFNCGKECRGFCNSHSIPAFVLRNIAVDGEIYSNNKVSKFTVIR